MTTDAPIPIVEHRGFRLCGVYGRVPAEDARDVVRMWIDAGVLPPAEAPRRVAELVVIARAPDGQVAGVNTAYVADVPGDRGAYYFYRTYLRPEYRGVAGVPTRMVRLALDELRGYRHPQAPRGVVVITENPKLMRRAAKARIEALGLHLLGSDARGCDVWCLKFDGSTPVAPPGLRPLMAALAAAGLALPLAAPAATIRVTTGGDSGTGATCTLRQAMASIDAASLQVGCATTGPDPFGTNDTVDLSLRSGTITLGGSEIAIVRAVALTGPAGGPTVLTISGNNASRVLRSTDGNALKISRLTIADGMATGSGGCILSDGLLDPLAAVELTDSIVKSCVATAVPAATTTETIGVGGGIAAPVVVLTRSTVSGNTAAAGGGVFAKYVLAEGSSISNNTVVGTTCNDADQNKYGCFAAVLGGGGVLANVMYSVASTISGNTVHASTITTTGDNPTTYTVAIGAVLIDTTISGNSLVGAAGADPKYLGGGVFSFGVFTSNSTISGNSATANGYGGGLFATNMVLRNSTIAGNTGIGGIVAAFTSMTPEPMANTALTPAAAPAFGTFVLQSTLVANNTGPGKDIECLGGPCTFTGNTSLVRAPGVGVTLPPDTIVNQDPLLRPPHQQRRRHHGRPRRRGYGRDKDDAPAGRQSGDRPGQQSRQPGLRSTRPRLSAGHRLGGGHRRHRSRWTGGDGAHARRLAAGGTLRAARRARLAQATTFRLGACRAWVFDSETVGVCRPRSSTC